MKPIKEDHLHITIGVLNIPEEDMEEVEQKFHKMVEVYRDIVKSRVGILVTCSSVKFFDHGAIVLLIGMGAQSLYILRDHLRESFGD